MFRVVSHPIDGNLWEVRIPCEYGPGESVAFIGNLFACLAWRPRI